MKKISFVILIHFICIFCTAQRERENSWLADIEHLLLEIKRQHYVYKNKELPASMIKQIEFLKNNIVHFSDERILIELQRVMFHLGDGHSYVLPFGARQVPAHYLPLHFYAFSDGMYVIDANENYQHLIGLKVLKIGQYSVEKMMQDMQQYISQDNVMGASWIGPFFIRFRGMLEAYGLTTGASVASIQFESKGKRKWNEQVSFIPVPRLRGIPKMTAPKMIPSPVYLSQVHHPYWLKSMPEKKALYWQFNQVMNDENEDIHTFSKRLDSILTMQRPPLLIIDVRHNNGGNGELRYPLLTVIKKYEQSQKGKIIVITGRNTFSAAQIFITYIDKETDAVFAGEPSSSKPNFVGEDNEIILPNSGAMVSISNRYHENNKVDHRRWIEPDIPVLLTSKDYFAGIDPVLAEIFKRYAGNK